MKLYPNLLLSFLSLLVLIGLFVYIVFGNKFEHVNGKKLESVSVPSTTVDQAREYVKLVSRLAVPLQLFSFEDQMNRPEFQQLKALPRLVPNVSIPDEPRRASSKQWNDAINSINQALDYLGILYNAIDGIIKLTDNIMADSRHFP